MNKEISPSMLLQEIQSTKNILIVQDIDGVCVPLVKDPLKRKIDFSYIKSARKLKDEFAVLTNGEHQGYRGLNRIVQKACKESNMPREDEIYLPGLAAGGVEYQNQLGQVELPGVSEKELQFLKMLPKKMEEDLAVNLKKLLPMRSQNEINTLAKSAVLDTNFSPTINLNGIFNTIPTEIELQRNIQIMLEEIMERLIKLAKDNGLGHSFYLHVAPNLGKEKTKERIKFSVLGDVGTTDVQFMLSGAVKEAGLLVLINKFIHKKYGNYPFDEKFNVRIAPKGIEALKLLCSEKISEDQMPLLIGIGDTVTSNPCTSGKGWLRGGSDRGFLTLIQELGDIFNKRNKVILVDSSGGEVDRPSLCNQDLKGISDPEDPLKVTTYFRHGPKEYVEWFNQLADERESKIF